MENVKQRRAKKRVTEVLDELTQARQCYATSTWADAFALFSQADKEAPLSVADLELLATSAYLIGQDDVFLDTLDRAHGAIECNGPLNGTKGSAAMMKKALTILKK